MTNNWPDLEHAQVILIEGSNAAENHPLSMHHIMKAKANGAVVIHVDPRFTRTSTIADLHAQIRPGTDIAFIGAIIRYVLENRLYDEEYVSAYTNARYLVNPEYGFSDGLFAGFNPETHKYDATKWAYRLGPDGKPLVADSLEAEGTVFAALRQHFRRYDLETAQRITGIPASKIEEIARTFASRRPGTILYALGITQHTTGVQNIRAYAILQMLLGNIGVPGGGVNALRGETNVQGATDMAVAFNYLPGYLKPPAPADKDLKAWFEHNGSFRGKFLVNLLKAWFGSNATPENDFGFGWLPKGQKPYSSYHMFEAALRGDLKFLWIMGQNPAVSNANVNLTRRALEKVELLVVTDLFETETASFWKRPGVDPKTIPTEVILLPAASFLEKEGTVTNSSRWVQWRYRAVPPVGQAKTDAEIIDAVFRRVRDLYAGSSDPKDETILKAAWNYDPGSIYDQVLREINGYHADGSPVKGIAELQADGSTSSGNWMYAGLYAGGENLTKRRDRSYDPGGLHYYPHWAWSWPGNMRVLYNRASARPDGSPRRPDLPLVWWDAAAGKWAGYDVPDVTAATDAPDSAGGRKAFRMNAEGAARLMAPTYADPGAKPGDPPRDVSTVLADGPFPEFYEPVESPVPNPLHPDVPVNPVVIYPRLKSGQPVGKPDRYPVVLTTGQLTEHWLSGGITRNIPWLNEIMPEPFVEMSLELARELGVRPGDKVRVETARGQVVMKALPTARIRPLQVDGRTVQVVWMPPHWGYAGLDHGPSANEVTIDALDPNASIQETKACLCRVEKV